MSLYCVLFTLRSQCAKAGLEISTHPLAQASVKTTWASTNPRLFVAFIKGTRALASAVKVKFSSLPRLNFDVGVEFALKP